MFLGPTMEAYMPYPVGSTNFSFRFCVCETEAFPLNTLYVSTALDLLNKGRKLPKNTVDGCSRSLASHHLLATPVHSNNRKPNSTSTWLCRE